MKYLQFYDQLLADCSTKCSTTAPIRDLATIKARYNHEGLSFLTITLPTFLDDFMQAVEEGQVDSNHFIGWKKRWCLPAFLQGFTNLVFDAKNGRLKDVSTHQVEAIRAIRQICTAFKKVGVACSQGRERKALEDYLQIDDDLEFLLEDITWDDFQDFKKCSRLLWFNVFGEDFDIDNLIPHHGPGSTAERIRGNRKYDPRNYVWPSRLNAYFRKGEVLFSSEENENLSPPVVEVDEDHELPVQVITVPKTLKNPRIIAMEPVVMQMLQQGIKDFVVDRLENNPLTKGHVNFSDQGINQDLALAASTHQRLATLDMSAASDRVHKDLIWEMLAINPKLRDLVFVTRSTTASVCIDGIMHKKKLAKFASMGSALCFPMEAMFFMTCATIGLLRHRDLPLTSANVRSCVRELYVYGDDLIVPTDAVDSVVNTLSIFGNVTSLSKSFWKGKFRESCGIDAYAGYDVTPTYIRREIPDRKWNSQAIISLAASANLLWKKGFCGTATYLRKEVERCTGFSLPVKSDHSEGIGWSFGDCVAKRRYNRSLQRIEVLTLVAVAGSQKDPIYGYNALTKSLLKLELQQSSMDLAKREILLADRKFDRSLFRSARMSVTPNWLKLKQIQQHKDLVEKDHLRTTTRSGALTLKRRWVALV